MPKRKDRSLGKATVKKLLLLFGIRLQKWCKNLSESTNHIWKQVGVCCTLPKTKKLQLSEKIIPSQIQVENSFANSDRTLFLKISFANSLQKRRFYSSKFDGKSDAHKDRPNLKTSQPLSHDTESYLLYILFFRKIPSRKTILHSPTQLNNYSKTIKPQSHNAENHEPFQKRRFFHNSVSKKMVCTSDLNSTSDTKA